MFLWVFSKLIRHEWIPERPGLWIPDSSVIWIPDSSVRIPDSKTLDSRFLNQQKVGFRIPDYLTRGECKVLIALTTKVSPQSTGNSKDIFILTLQIVKNRNEMCGILS
jgi:hypothetical protein